MGSVVRENLDMESVVKKSVDVESVDMESVNNVGGADIVQGGIAQVVYTPDVSHLDYKTSKRGTDMAKSTKLDKPAILSTASDTIADDTASGEDTPSVESSNVVLSENRQGDLGLISTIRKVYRKKQMSQRDFGLIARCAVVLNVLTVFLFYGTMYTLCSLTLKTRAPWLYKMPWGENDTIVIMLTVTFCVTFLMVTVCTVVCLQKRNHPLVKSRGVFFIAGVGLTSAIVSVLQYCIALSFFIPAMWDQRKHHMALYLLMAEYVTVTATLSLIVARERILFVIFIRHPFKRHVRFHRYFTGIVGCMFILSVFCFLPYLLAHLLQWNNISYYALFVLIPWGLSMGLLAYYTYRTRKISESFSDWRSNCRIGIVLAVASNLIVFFAVFNVGNTEYGGLLPNSWKLFFFYHASMAKIGYTVMDLFALLAIISAGNVGICKKLSPTASTWKSSFDCVTDPAQTAQI